MDGYLQAQMEFLEACSAGDIGKTALLLESGRVDINFHHRVNGWTGLHWAARRGHVNIVNLLLRTGFDPRTKAKDGRTPIDVATEPLIKTILEQYSLPPTADLSSDTMIQLDSSSNDSPVRELNKNAAGEGDVPSPPADATPSNKTMRTNSLDSMTSPPPVSPTTPTRKQELYSYGRRDSLDRTRFLLVRTRMINEIDASWRSSVSFGRGKEAFRRVTLPGGGSVEFMKLTIERAMKMGTVVKVITLPDRVPIETQEQIRNLADCQKVEAIFEPSKKGARKSSLTEKTYSEAKPIKKRAARVKALSMNDEYMTNASGDAPFGEITHDSTSITTETTGSSHSSARIPEVGMSISNDSVKTVSSPQADTSTLSLAREVFSSTPPEESILEDGRSESEPQNGASIESWKGTAVEENIGCDISLTNKSSHNQGIHLTVVSASNGRLVRVEGNHHSNKQKLEVRKNFIALKSSKQLPESTVALNDSKDAPESTTALEESKEMPKEAIPAEDGEEVSESTVALKDSREVSEDAVTSEEGKVILENAVAKKNSKQVQKNAISSEGSKEIPENTIAVMDNSLPEENIIERKGGKEVWEDVRTSNENRELWKTSTARKISNDVLRNVVAPQNGKRLRDDVHAPKDSKARKLLNALIGDENDPRRRMKIAVLVSGVVGVSGGVAYYLFVRVK